jgi:hypothetical protein
MVMMKMKNISIFILTISVMMLNLTSCNDVASSRNKDVSVDNLKTIPGGTTSCPEGVVNCSIGSQEAIDNAEIIEAATVEIRHLIEPKLTDGTGGGTYEKKLTLPKNYNGLLYLAGINISTLASKNVKVRFNFGLDSSPITIDATVSSAAGLTPQTDVQVLILDLKSKPFNDIQLIYDLFDYNDYLFTGDGSLKLNEPVQSNRNKKLYCRGLKLEDDPTFTGNLSSKCTDSTDVCKYSYAKVIDQGLVSVINGVDTPITPSEAEIQSGSKTYFEDSNTLKLSRCLPNNPSLSTSVALGTYKYKFDDVVNAFSASTLTSRTIDTVVYQYKGPYRLSSTSSWQINADPTSTTSAMFGIYGLFSSKQNLIGNGLANDPYMYNSKLFPLATKFNLLKDTEYLGSSVPDGAKVVKFMASNGESEWMDGCNARATSVDDITGENIGSCNVTSRVEIITIDDDGVETPITSKEVKLQLVKPSTINSTGDDVLHSSFQSCSSSNQCGSEECCINKRCWDKSIVSQCVEDMPTYGLLNPGASCSSDYECSSLCCSQTTGRCAVHDTLQDPPVLCSKGSGQRCIAKEWCAKQPVTRCFIIKTGFDPQGAQSCALRCYTFEEHGDCANGICKPPPAPVMPSFNPNDPLRCQGAYDPPDFSNGYYDFTSSTGN